MEFTDIQWKKTVEGNYDVQLIRNNVIVAVINFPTETLAVEYVDIKKKLKAHADALIAEVTANLTKTKSKAKVDNAVVSVPETKEEQPVKNSEDKVETFTANVKNRIEKEKGIDVSAHVGHQQDRIDTSAKVSKDTIIDTSAKVVVP